jgi:transposase
MIIPGDDPVSKGAQRFEVFTGAGKRRDWPPEMKASIVAECYAGGEGVSAVARRYGLDPSQIYAWRKNLHRQLVDHGLAPLVAESGAVTFVPALIEPTVPLAPAASPTPARRGKRRRRVPAAAMELEIDGVAVKIARGADAGMIAAVIRSRLAAHRDASRHDAGGPSDEAEALLALLDAEGDEEGNGAES